MISLSTILWSVYAFGFFFLLFAIAKEDLKRNKLRADNLICGGVILTIWPVIAGIFLLLTGFYTTIWLLVPSTRRSVGLRDGIRDFWS
jgi:hypothetical protein